MSRFTVPSIVDCVDEVRYQEVAYGFDHVLGPFFQRFDAEGELVEDIAYLFTRSFDCHALAEKLGSLADEGEMEDSQELRRHIRFLWLDLPI